MSAAPDFNGFPAETLPFLSQLKENNRRDWFEAHRDGYETAVKQPATAFAALMEGRLEKLTGVAQTAKVFRIHRDVRFSKDKMPYNTHIHIGWMPREGGDSAPGFMFGVAPKYCTAGCGVFEFSKPVLEAYRHRIAGREGKDLGALVGELEGSGYRISDVTLKRLPAGFTENHPYPDLALRKGIVCWWDFAAADDATRPDLPDLCMERFRELLPLWKFLAGLGGEGAGTEDH